MTPTPTSGAADLPEALRLADIADDESWALVIGVRKDIAAELRRLHALAAGQATAAQHGVAYAALPTSNYAGRVYEEGFLIGTCPLYTADQMRAFADATHAIRASHWQALAGAGEVAEHYRNAIASACEGWTMPDGLRKHLETALWSPPTPQPTQPVEREPLTPERVKEIVRGAGYDQCGIPDTERAAFINGLRHGEREHGIKGGQHGTE